MRHLRLMSLLCAAGCVSKAPFHPPPKDAFYFPTGIVYADSRGMDEARPFLYVASSNFDRRFDTGAVTAVDLGLVRGADGGSLPSIGQLASGLRPQTFENLGQTGQVLIQTFAGEMEKYAIDGGWRLFVPSRGERNPLQSIDAQGLQMRCTDGGSLGGDCSQTAPSLTALENTPTGKPRAPEPIGVGLPTDGKEVFITHLRPADSPAGSGNLFETYVVRLSADSPGIDLQNPEQNFVSLGFSAVGYGPTTSSVAVGSRYAYVTSRYHGFQGAMLLLVDRQQSLVKLVSVESSFRTLEARGIAAKETGTSARLYVAARSPDSLVVINVTNVNSDAPSFQVMRTVTLPPEPNQVRIISRDAQLDDLVVVTSSRASAVSIYDQGLGVVVAQLFGVGVQPYGIAVQSQDQGARIFVSCFGDGRIAVIDISDLQRPQNARLTAFLGRAQICPSTTDEISCLGNPP